MTSHIRQENFSNVMKEEKDWSNWINELDIEEFLSDDNETDQSLMIL